MEQTSRDCHEYCCYQVAKVICKDNTMIMMETEIGEGKNFCYACWRCYRCGIGGGNARDYIGGVIEQYHIPLSGGQALCIYSVGNDFRF